MPRRAFNILMTTAPRLGTDGSPRSPDPSLLLLLCVKQMLLVKRGLLFNYINVIYSITHSRIAASSKQVLTHFHRNSSVSGDAKPSAVIFAANNPSPGILATKGACRQWADRWKKGKGCLIGFTPSKYLSQCLASHAKQYFFILPLRISE